MQANGWTALSVAEGPGQLVTFRPLERRVTVDAACVLGQVSGAVQRAATTNFTRSRRSTPSKMARRLVWARARELFGALVERRAVQATVDQIEANAPAVGEAWGRTNGPVLSMKTKPQANSNVMRPTL